MNNKDKFKVPADYLLHQEEGSDHGQDAAYFLFDVKRGGVFNLNATSYDFLTRCDGTRTMAEIVQSLSELYQVSTEVLESDFKDLVKQWLEMGILHVEPSASAKENSDFSDSTCKSREIMP